MQDESQRVMGKVMSNEVTGEQTSEGIKEARVYPQGNRTPPRAFSTKGFIL